ncbi:MAG: C40 family peptidase, partial [Xanthomonadales bacterium]|nr:C40 family peptidase [Xanthomonadales bacterium]
WLAPTTIAPASAGSSAAAEPADSLSPVQLLTRLADGLRNIRYKRGGRSPKTGFDCSGFVRYVFRQGIGAELPNTSSAQFHTGHAVARDDLRSGDLVFFRTRGKRVSHVGIYLGEGRFIHAPSSGKTVSISSLSEHYWSRRFAGARRPDVLVEHSGDSLLGSS